MTTSAVFFLGSKYKDFTTLEHVDTSPTTVGVASGREFGKDYDVCSPLMSSTEYEVTTVLVFGNTFDTDQVELAEQAVVNDS